MNSVISATATATGEVALCSLDEATGAVIATVTLSADNARVLAAMLRRAAREAKKIIDTGEQV
jgi:hypothetical protein